MTCRERVQQSTVPESSKADERRASLRVIEGSKGNGAPAMWQRLYDLHAKEEVRTITEAERQEMQMRSHGLLKRKGDLIVLAFAIEGPVLRQVILFHQIREQRGIGP
jgi:hypothetical protein